MLWSDLDITSWDFKRTSAVQTIITKQNLQVLHVPAGTSVLPIAFSMQLEDAIQVWDLSSLLEQNPEQRSENLQKLQQDYQRLKERWLMQYEGTQQATLLGQLQEQGIFPAVPVRRFGAELYIEPTEQKRLLLLLRYAARTIIGEQGTPQDLNRVLHQLQQQTTAVVPFKHVTVPPPPPVPDVLEKAYKAVQSLALPNFIDIPDSVLTKFQQFTLRLQAGRSSIGYIVKYLAAANMLSTLAKTNKSMLERYELLDLPAIDESYLLTFALAENIPQTSTYSVHKSWNDAFRTAAASTADLSDFKEVSLDQLAQHLQKAKEATAEPIKVPLHVDATGAIYLWLVPKRLGSYAYSSSIGWRPAAGWLSANSANSAIQVYPALDFVLQGYTTNTLGRFPQVSTGVPQQNSYWCYTTSLLMHKFSDPEVTTNNTWWQSAVPDDISMSFVNYYVGPVHLRADVQASYKPYGKPLISQKGIISKTFTPIQVSVQGTVVVGSAQVFAYIRQSLGWAAMGSLYTQSLDYVNSEYQVLFQHNSKGVGVDSSTHLIAWQDYKGKRAQDFPDNYNVKYLGGAVNGLITASLSAEEVEEQHGWYKYVLNLITWKDPIQHLEPQPDAHTVVSEVKLPCTPTIQTQVLQLVSEMYTKPFVLKPVPTYEVLKGIWDALTPQHYAQLVAGVGDLKDIEGNYTY